MTATLLAALLLIVGCTTQRDVEAAYERGFAHGNDEAEAEAEDELSNVQRDLRECRGQLDQAKKRRAQRSQTAMTQQQYLSYCDHLEEFDKGMPKSQRGGLAVRNCREFRKQVEEAERQRCFSDDPALAWLAASDPECKKYRP